MDYPNKWKCPNCSELVERNKICPVCNFKFGTHYPKLWGCPNCSSVNSGNEFCKDCDYPNNLSAPKLWHCHNCQNLVKDSSICDICGFELKELKDVPAIEKKVPKKELLSKKNIYAITIGVIALSIILIFFSIDFSPNPELFSQAFAGQAFSKDYLLATNLNKVIFELTSPSGKFFQYFGVKKSENIWSLNNIYLNESGNWSIKIIGFSGLSTIESLQELSVKSSCTNESGCLNGICCNGSCFTPCINDSSCGIGKSCINPNTCQSFCETNPLECNTVTLDGVCPAGCNIYNDADCVSCGFGEIVCNNACKKVCKSNNDCNDNDSLTFDKCILMNDKCNNYCENKYYLGTCSDGKVEYNGYCITPLCFTKNDCIKEGFYYNCINPGEVDAYCSYFTCTGEELLCFNEGIDYCKTPACISNEDCSTGFCQNPGKCNAKCI